MVTSMEVGNLKQAVMQHTDHYSSHKVSRGALQWQS